MINTTTERFTEKQALIEQIRGDVVTRYPVWWSRMIADWHADDKSDAVWLMYSANYLLRTNGIRWAIDPYTLNCRIPAAPRMDLARDLEGLSFVLLTHDHHDHLDLELIRELRDKPIRWVIPPFMLEKVRGETGLAEEKIIVPRVMRPLELSGITILPFEAQHLITYPDGTSKGVPEMGYRVDCAEKRWLFPGDTRVYDISRMPKFAGVDAVFAHLWLGHGRALDEPKDIEETFCEFFAGLHPGRVILTHLEEFGRDANDFFDCGHAQRLARIFAEEYPEINCSSRCMGEKVIL